MKQYKTLEELLREISATRKYDIDLEAAIAYQDLIGHSTAQELSDFANGDFKDMFYNVYQVAYGTIDTLRFYAQHSNYCIDLRYYKDELSGMLEQKQAAYEQLQVEKNEANEKLAAALLETHKVEKELKAEKELTEAQAAEIVQLKARLYDLMTDKL